LPARPWDRISQALGQDQPGLGTGSARLWDRISQAPGQDQPGSGTGSARQTKLSQVLSSLPWTTITANTKAFAH